MKISKTAFCLLVLSIFFLIASLPAAVAYEGLVTWPIERDASGAVKAKATFTLHEKIINMNSYNCPTNANNPYPTETEVDMIMRIRTGNSFTYDIVTAKAPGTYCLAGGYADLSKQFAILDFLNSDAVLALICPDCNDGAVVHLKRVFDDVWNYEDLIVPGPPPSDAVYSAVGDFELVINETPIDWYGYTTSP